MSIQTDSLVVRLTDPHALRIETKGGQPVLEVDTLSLTVRITGRILLNSISLSIVNKTGDYTAAITDYVITCDANGGAFTVTLPAASGVTGKIYHIKKTDSSGNAVTVDGNASETIDGDTTKVISTQYDSMEIICDGSNWHII